MLAIIGSCLFSIVIILSILLICGLPLGELTMGGQYRILPKKFRIMAISQLIIQVFAVIIILQSGGVVSLWFSYKTTGIICFVFATYLSLNTIMNILSRSKKEKYIMTPLSFLAAICFWITALQM
ncbi:MAG: hypothetical protein QM697_05675 [Lachnospiraceae bacterium]